MASYQRVALYLLFDSIEHDLVKHIRNLAVDVDLTEDEKRKAGARIESRTHLGFALDSDFDLLQGLDIAEKYDVLLRHKAAMPEADRAYFLGIAPTFKSIVSVRNSVMHGRPLTIGEYSQGFAFAQTLLRSRSRWPVLAENYLRFTKDPALFTSRSIQFLDDPGNTSVLHNLPAPEYDDTGFLPRPNLERELRKRILGRHPVVTILGEGGNGKTALALQTLYGLIASNDHPFDAIIWYSAKNSVLTAEGVRRIGENIVSATSIIEEAASFEPGSGSPHDRLYELLERNKILLVIDNLETVQGDDLQKLAQDVPGESKLLLTSRVPLGGDLSVNVGEFEDKDALIYLRRLFDAYEVKSLRSRDDPSLLRYLKRLHNKPLLIKWFVLGVKSGASPESIVANPEMALRFCLENVVGRLGHEAKLALITLATVAKPLSAQLLEHITELNARETEIALNELGRFGLIDLQPSEGSEQLYKLRPFARAYAIRVLAPRPDFTAEIRSRYHRVEFEYESARGVGNYNPYSLRNYKVRSPAEMLAAKKLNKAVQMALQGDFEGANEVIEQVRITDPGYFEVYRIQGYVSSVQGDTFASSVAYESALEIAPDEPQLNFFYGCMLMRGVDNGLADSYFQKAIALDPGSLPAYREAARNCFATNNFERAEELLDAAKDLGFKAHKDKVVYTDLRIQMYGRKIYQRVQAKDWETASATVKDLAHFVYGLDLNIFDERMTEHLVSVVPNLGKIEEVKVGGPSFAADLSEWIRTKFLSPKTPAAVSSRPGTPLSGPASGSLKQDGLQETFGFVRADDGRETFVHSSDAGPELWRRMIAGARVRYNIVVNANGTTRATNLVPI